MELKEPTSPQSDVELIQQAFALLRQDIALQILGRALTEDELNRIARARVALPHLEQALAALERKGVPL